MNDLRKFRWLAAPIAAAALWVFYTFDPQEHSFFPRCILHSTTGLHCPGCGTQRAVHQALHGNILAAIDYNALAAAALPFLLYGLYLRVGTQLGRLNEKQSFFYAPLFRKVTVIVVISFFIARNLPLYPFNILSPDF